MGEARAPAPSVREDEADETAAATAPIPDERATTNNSVDEPESVGSSLDAANDNSPLEDLPATGTQ
jgi:hypothetical protein